jgi:hypothetical protein
MRRPPAPSGDPRGLGCRLRYAVDEGRPAPISSCVISRIRFCSSKLQDATPSMRLMVIADRPVCCYVA